MKDTDVKEKTQQAPVLHAGLPNEEYHLSFSPGKSVYDILAPTNIRIHAACGGVGACGRCRIRIEEGTVNAPSKNELTRLTPDQIRCGIRLACQVRPFRDIRIRLENLEPQTSWRDLVPEEYAQIEFPTQSLVTETLKGFLYGAAVDVGTTQIRMSFWDIEKRQRIAGRSGLNPQSGLGADVLTRVAAASESAQRAQEIGQLAREALREALQDLAFKENRRPQAIGHIVIVGNTAMLALLTEQNYQLLLQPEYWMQAIECRPQDLTSWRLAWGLDERAEVNVIQPLAGFVGSDLLAGVLATKLTQGQAGSLLIDFGTNSEIALWDGSLLWVTSAAGGPAFEGNGISCGMSAEPGAIYKIEYRDAAPENSCPEEQPRPSKILSDRAVRSTVIGGGPALGLCGSGLVDGIAYLRKTGILKNNGIFSRNVGKEGFFIGQGERNIVINQRDIDVFQRAKAAIGAGIACLLQAAGMKIKDVQRLCVCGAFGRFLNVTNAQNIGILPRIAPQNVELWGNAALAGSEILLFSPDIEDMLDSLRRQTRIINLSSVPTFEGLFINHLALQPMQME